MDEVKKQNKKYDWPALKQEFFESNFLEVFSFMRHKFGTKTAQSGNVKKHIIGWKKAKSVWRWQQFMGAQNRTEKAQEEHKTGTE